MTLPSVRALRQAFPESDLHMMVKKWVRPVFERDPNIDTVIEYRKEFEGVTGKLVGSQALKKVGYDTAILFQNAFDAAIITYLAGIPERLGYNRDARGFLLTGAIKITPEAKRLHHILYYLNLLKNLGIKPIYRHPWIYIDMEEHLSALNRISSLKRPVVLLNPGAVYGSAKRWPTGHFSELSKMIITELYGSVVITGSKGETAIADEIVNGLDKDLVNAGTLLNLSGKTDLRELIGLISKADAVVTNDSGPMHLTYAVGAPLVALFGSTDPALTGPPAFANPGSIAIPSDIELDSRSIVLKRDLDCSPCFERECPGRNTKCLVDITPREVLDALRGIIPTNKAAFFDRDGTLCRDADYLNRMDDLEIFPEVRELIHLKEKGYILIGISNQSGVARGIVEREFTERVIGIFTGQYGFDGFYYCPHHPDENCACRKPSSGMVLKARKDFNIDLRNSIVVGDKESDMELARTIGARALLLKPENAGGSIYADESFRNLTSLINYIHETYT